MSSLYADSHRRLQDRFDTRRLADRLELALVHADLTQDECGFIESRDMLFLSTVDPQGRPTVSYKGGATGFVRVQDGEIVFACYDGNGMFYSMGNVTAHAQVGLLFIDFETPHRLRVQGLARLDDEEAALAAFPGALMLVRVRPTEVFVNCSRYVHSQRRERTSRYVPDESGHAPLAQWKRIDFVQDVLPEHDRQAVESEGTITAEQYGAQLLAGKA